MELLPHDVKAQVRERFQADLDKKVKIILFTQKLNCQFCVETETLLREVAALSDGRIELEVKSLINDEEEARNLGIDKAPGMAILALDEDGSTVDYGIRYYGIPSGYEFGTLIEDLIMVSRRTSGLSSHAIEHLKEVDTPVHVQVFVTPTCPYCPAMVHMAHQAAMENENIRADMVEVSEFPELGTKYNVYGVPKTVINETVEFEGLVPEEHFIHELLHAVGQHAHE
jgi:glutaredoxin-like protein